MNEPTHTPGPWMECLGRIDGEAYGFHISSKKHGSIYPIAQSVSGDGSFAPYTPKEYEGNAKLMAAAPDLLNACKAALEVLNLVSPGLKHDVLENAIEKAEGRS